MYVRLFVGAGGSVMIMCTGASSVRPTYIHFLRCIAKWFACSAMYFADSILHRLGQPGHGMGSAGLRSTSTKRTRRHITSELPSPDENDAALEIANGVLSISGEKSKSEDKARRFSERYYGRFKPRYRWKTSMKAKSRPRSRTAY